MNKTFNGVMLGLQVFFLLALASYGLYSLLVRAFGDTFWFIPVIGVTGLVALTVERLIYQVKK